MQEELFNKSGLNEWREDSIKRLKKEYNQNILKYYPLSENVTSLRDWVYSGESWENIYTILSIWLQDHQDIQGKSIPKRITRNNAEKIKNSYLNSMDDKYNRWIRKLSPFSLSLNSAYLTIAEYLIQKLLDVRLNYLSKFEIGFTNILFNFL